MRVDDAVERLYAAFSGVPKPTAIDTCPCCFDEGELDELLTYGDRRTIPADALASYAASVLSTAGDVDDFRYYLPRLLDIAFGDGFSWPDLEIVLGRLRRAQHTTWVQPEREAIADLLAAHWDRVLSGGSEHGAETLLCGLGNAEDDLAPYLATWTARMGEPPAAAALRDLLQGGVRRKRNRDRLANAFWGDRHAQEQQVLDWLASPGLRSAVEAALATADEDAHLTALCEVSDLLPLPRVR